MSSEIINVILQLVDNFSNSVDKVTKKIDGIQSSANAVTAAFTPLSAATGGALAVSGKLAADFQKSLDSASKAMGLNSKEATQFRQEILKVQKDLNYAFGAKQIADIAQVAGKLGIAADNVDDFVSVIAKLAVATDTADIPKLAEDAAKISGVFKLNTQQLGEFSGAVNRLDDALPISAQQIINFTQRTSAMAKTSKISAQAISAWGAVLISSGKAPESAATAMNAVIQKMGAATNLSVPAQKALLKLGYSASDLAKRFDKDANGTMLEFFKRVKQLDTVSQRDILGRIFGQEHISSAQLLLSRYDDLLTNLTMVGDKTGNAAKINSEFAKQQASLAGQTERFKNIMQTLGIQIGSAVLPGILQLLDGISPLIEKFAEFGAAHPDIVATIAALLTVASVVAPISALVSAIAGAIPIIVAVAGAIGTVAALIVSVPGVVALAVAAVIAGFAAAAMAIHKNWYPIKGFFINLWMDMARGFDSFVWKLRGGIDQAYKIIVNFGNWILGLGRSFYDAAINWGTGLIDGFINGIYSRINSAKSAISNFTNQIGQYLPHSDAQKGALSTLTASGQAFGDTFMRGIQQSGLTSQLGAVMTPNAGASQAALLPVRNTATPASGSQPINIVYNISGTGNDELIKQLKRRDRDLLDVINQANKRVNRSSY